MSERSANGGAASTLEGDRPCVKCGFNLIGQPIVREEHYGMLMARCPECGSVAPLMEYPSVSRWTRRLIALVAALWLVGLIGVSVGAGAAMFGMTMAASHESAGDFARGLEAMHAREAEAAAVLPSASAAGPSASPHVVVHMRSAGSAPKDWLDAQDLGARFERWGGWGMVAREVGILVLPMGIVTALAGLFLGVCVLHQRGWRLALVSALPVGIAVCLHAVAWAGRHSGWSTPAEDAALAYLWPRVTALGLGLALGLGAMSALLARPIARGFVRMMLPPRLRAPLYPLWEADGRPPPRPARRAAGVSRPSA